MSHNIVFHRVGFKVTQRQHSHTLVFVNCSLMFTEISMSVRSRVLHVFNRFWVNVSHFVTDRTWNYIKTSQWTSCNGLLLNTFHKVDKGINPRSILYHSPTDFFMTSTDMSKMYVSRHHLTWWISHVHLIILLEMLRNHSRTLSSSDLFFMSTWWLSCDMINTMPMWTW